MSVGGNIGGGNDVIPNFSEPMSECNETTYLSLGISF